MSDVQALIRRLGAVCGRPRKQKDDPDFNFVLGLRCSSAEELAEVERALREICPGGGPSAETAPAQEGAFFTVTGGAEKGEGVPEPGPSLPPPPQTPAAGLAPEGKSSGGDLGGADGIFGASLPVQPGSRVEVPPPQAAAQPSGLVPFFDEVKGPAPASKEAAPPPAPPRKAAEPPRAFPLPSPPSAPILQRLASQPAFGSAMVPDHGSDLESLQVGAFNRFAHAAAVSAVTNPGDLYNPLFVCGGPGTGKSHLLDAAANKMLADHPGGKIWVTSGTRLSVAAQIAAARGAGKALEEFAGAAKALFIDDIHLLEVSDQTGPILTGILRAFLGARKQVVMTSAYPARVLGALEGALQFRIASGWSGDIKLPGPEVQAQIALRILQGAGFDPGPEGAKKVLEGAENSLAEASAAVSRMAKMRDLLARGGKRAVLEEMMSALLGPALPERETALAEAQSAVAGPAPLPDGPRGLALCFPAGCEPLARLAVRRLQENARKYSWPFPYRAGKALAYDPNKVTGVPFSLGVDIRRAGADAALVVGPSPGTEMASREGEFSYALGHILSSLTLPMAWFPCLRLQHERTVLRALLDVTEVPA
jgi:hypothetical protein